MSAPPPRGAKEGIRQDIQRLKDEGAGYQAGARARFCYIHVCACCARLHAQQFVAHIAPFATILSRPVYWMQQSGVIMRERHDGCLQNV